MVFALSSSNSSNSKYFLARVKVSHLFVFSLVCKFLIKISFVFTNSSCIFKRLYRSKFDNAIALDNAEQLSLSYIFFNISLEEKSALTRYK